MEEVADTFVLLKEKFRLMRNFRMNEMKGMSAKDFSLARFMVLRINVCFQQGDYCFDLTFSADSLPI